MKKTLHIAAALLATLCIASFFLSSLVVELFGTQAQIANIKHLIVTPGLWVLIPAMMLTGVSAQTMGRSGSLVRQKQHRMKIIAINGLLVLLPCALVLKQLVTSLDTGFYLLQAVELLAGATNLVLMSLNIRDGLKLSGRRKQGPRQPLAAN
ncbi:hypothetical protein [Shewanella sedimentimangrovi]|uniref:Lipoprotein n=1 Tax=Shewanella sedimentimangrovi TaxID=2814293 RepID=A0ABX7R4C8_9GAMM|nr:hypothetical protein [Shewanella sedimentimangrovi]QSX38672.1 hypothetical protein JYB85_07635 [Shewanella sedimentimangrovi]